MATDTPAEVWHVCGRMGDCQCRPVSTWSPEGDAILRYTEAEYEQVARDAYDRGLAAGRAEEREACARLAEQHRATYPVVTTDASCLEGETRTQVSREPFGDLIRGRAAQRAEETR